MDLDAVGLELLRDESRRADLLEAEFRMSMQVATEVGEEGEVVGYSVWQAHRLAFPCSLREGACEFRVLCFSRGALSV